MTGPRKWRAEGEERRRTTRVKKQLFAAIDIDGDPLCVVVDVSRNGLGLRAALPPKVGERLTVRLGVGERIAALPAIVRRVIRRVAGGYTIGLEWLEADERELALIDAFAALVALMPPRPRFTRRA
ncbi:MAG: PilZ domain-containing protein [Planctomycetes bacterium]|nr:PilZ domain-containing protein [Planctomycetota bacterium]